MMVVALLLLVGTISGALISGSVRGVARGRAQAIADLVALAAVSDPAAASTVASANNARVVSLRVDGATTTVEVVVGGEVGRAAAVLSHTE